MPAVGSLKDARKKVRDKYGRALAEKATGDLLRVLAASRPAFALEGAAVERSAIVEFTRTPPSKALAGPAPESAVSLDSARWTAIGQRKDAFQKASEDVRTAVERRPTTRASAAEKGRTPVETSWLIRAMRVPMDGMRRLADAAAHDAIASIDLPRALQPELHATGALVGARAYRKARGRTGKGVAVAVIDSEVATAHPAFGERAIKKENFTAEPWGKPDAHGTAVAGIIGGRNRKYSGIAPGVDLYTYKVLATRPSLSGDDFDAALAIQQALEDRARIANCSWGAGPVGDGTSREAVACDEAWALGLILVKSAGNRGPGAGTMTTPADARGVIVVGATDRAGQTLTDYSSRGPAHTRKGPDLLAPGGLDDDPMWSCLVPEGFGDVSYGTSFAAPHVTGVLALLLEGNPALTPDQAKDALLALCVPMEGLSAAEQGRGRLFIA